MKLFPGQWPAWLSGTVRRQLIWGVALVHAVMMSLFVYDLSLRQRDFLIESQASQAVSLAQNLSLISATPLLSSDLAGLQELTTAISAYPGVVHVMVLLPGGKIVAHGQRELRGQFLADFDRFGKVIDPQPQPQPLLLLRSQAMADVVMPVSVNQDRIGWVRVGVSQSATATKLAAITQSGLMYTLLAIVVGVVLASLLANRLTRRLTALAKVADDVSAGGLQVRAMESGQDEVSHLARAFNVMLNALEAQWRKEENLKVALQVEKELAQVTLASIGDAVITADAQGLVTFMNEAAQTLTGWPLSQVLRTPGADFLVFKDSTTQDRLPNPVARVLTSGVAAQSGAHTVMVARQGTLVPVESLASPIFGDHGCILGCVLVLRDVSEREMVQERLQWQAGHDALTGLPNRVLLTDRFEQALEKSNRDGTQLAVCLLDLDKFKPVNDIYGHAVGDALLVGVTARLNQELRAVDTLTRLGGDEFVILLEDLADAVDLTGLLDRILQTLAEPFEINGHHIEITCSLGLTVFPGDMSDPDTLLRHADQAMYVAKQTGRNRYHRFDVLQDLQQASEHQTQERVRQAIVDDELLLYYQPKVNLRSGVVQGFEALLHWQHPQDGMIPPLSFLPLVEQTDVIVDIGEWVITQALAQLAQWQDAGAVWPVSVNIAARHFQREDFFVRLQNLLAGYPQVSPALLEFEILESVALGDVDAINALMANCRALGIRFSLDDFGTGYSSLSYLKRIPVQTLKIDQSFVRDMLDDVDDLALVESIIHIASLFNLSVIAGGVETPDQGVLLMRLGCDVVQGYGIARPMPAGQVFTWAKQFQLDRQWRRWADVKWELSDLPLLMAQQDHVAWVKRVVLMTQGAPLGLPQAQLSDPHQCGFGHWFDGHGQQRYGDMPEFQAIYLVHRQVHALGSEIMQLHATGELAAAAELCAELLACKDQLLLLLDDLQQAALMKTTSL